MKLTYENERGKVVMCGGGADIFNIVEIRGLALPENDIDSVYYPNVAGCVVKSSIPQERMITISADAKDKTGKNISYAMSVFSMPGTITISEQGKSRKISARCVSFDTNKRKGIYVPFVLQLMAEDPYFTDIYDTNLVVNEREKKLSSQFVLPCALSLRKAEVMLINKGDVAIEPIITLTSYSGAVCPEGIVIKNLNNESVIKLNTDILPGEEITVDIKNRRVTSSLYGNYISRLANETSISDFIVDLGVSTLRITADDIAGDFCAQCTFNNRYICAY